MLPRVELVRHQITAGAGAKLFRKALMKLQRQRINLCQRLVAWLIASCQRADNHYAACHRAAQIACMTNAAAKAGAHTKSVIINIYACLLAKGFYNCFAAVIAALEIVACCHTDFFAEFTHAFLLLSADVFLLLRNFSNQIAPSAKYYPTFIIAKQPAKARLRRLFRKIIICYFAS